jgi:CSLREA domain-containing protein
MGTSGLRRYVGIGILAVAGTLLATSPAMAATITPNTFGDENGGGGSCSLREAIQAANTNAGFGGCAAGSGADSIPLATGTYQLAIAPDGTPDDNLDGDLDVIAGSNVTITHAGITPTAISGGGIDRILDIRPTGNATLSGVTIRDGRPPGSDVGGGILNQGGSLAISSSTLTNNQTNAFGGGISNLGGGTLTLTNVTISGNRANVDSGGLDNFQAGTTATLNNVTVTNNTADADADNNGSAGGIFNVGLQPVLNLRNTIVAGNRDDSPGTKAPDCDGAPTSQGNNLIGDLTNCEYVAAGGDKLNVNALLGPLADNGGSTFTHALLTGSPAINGAGAGAAPTDQRGVPRSSDIGAYELVSCGAVVVNRVGSSGNDTVTGTAAADGFLLLAGNDSASGLGGADALCGGDNRDKLTGGPGKDLLRGEGGKDKLKGGPGKDLLRGEGGKDKLKGGGGKDKLVGGPGPDILIGGKGKDRCKGGGGRDILKNC